MADYNSSHSGSGIDAAITKAALLTSILAGDGGKVIRAKSDLSGFELVTEYTNAQIDDLLAAKLDSSSLSTIGHSLELKDTVDVANDLGSSVSGNVDIDLEDGNVVQGTITGATNFTIVNGPGAGQAAILVLNLENAGLYTVTFVTTVTWTGNVSIPLQTSGRDILVLYKDEKDGSWLGNRFWRPA